MTYTIIFTVAAGRLLRFISLGANRSPALKRRSPGSISRSGGIFFVRLRLDRRPSCTYKLPSCANCVIMSAK
jgi:hypothetical protein